MSEEKKMITFEGSENYVVSDELANAVNVAIALLTDGLNLFDVAA